MTSSKKQRFWFWGVGLTLTAAWVMYVFLWQGISFHILKSLAPNEFGDFFAGFAAPIAFLWLVLGILLQGKELSLQYEELSESVKQQTIHTTTAEKNLKIETQKTILQIYDHYMERLATSASTLYYEIILAEGCTVEQADSAMNDAWERYDRGQRDTFFRAILFKFSSEKNVSVGIARMMLKGGSFAQANAFEFCGIFDEFIKDLESLLENLESGNHLQAAYGSGNLRTLYDCLSRALNYKSLPTDGSASNSQEE